MSLSSPVDSEFFRTLLAEEGGDVKELLDQKNTWCLSPVASSTQKEKWEPTADTTLTPGQDA